MCILEFKLIILTKSIILMPLCVRCSQLCGSLENIWPPPRRPESLLITMATSCWTALRSVTAETCVVDSPSGSSAYLSSEPGQTTRASISAAPPAKTSSMVTTWTSRKCTRSASLRGELIDSWLITVVSNAEQDNGECVIFSRID